MLMKLCQMVVILGLVAIAFAQTNSTIETTSLETYYEGSYSGRKQFILPARISKFFPKVLLVRNNRKLLSAFEEKKLVSLLKTIKFFSSSQYSVTTIHDRSEFPCVEFDGSRYIFAGESFDIDTDTEVFNLLLGKADLKIESEKEAAELAYLYFSVTRGYFENRGKLILSGVEDVPLSYRQAKEAEAKRLLEIVSAPKTKLVGKSYVVELFTWEMALGEVRKWEFKIHSDAQVEVQSETIGRL